MSFLEPRIRAVYNIESYGSRTVKEELELNPKYGKRMKKRHNRLSKEGWRRLYKQ